MKYPRINYMNIARTTGNFEYILRSGCQILYLISGDVRYFVENQVYELEPSDIIITNQSEIHKPTFTSNKTYERITLEFDPVFYSQFSTESFDLLACFYNRNSGAGNRIRLAEEDDARIRELFSRFEQAYEGSEDSRDVQMNAILIEILVLLNKAASPIDEDMRGNMSRLVTDVIDYIEENLDADLSLEALENVFYVSGEHICRSFKAETGITIHKFIVKKRVAYAKRLLAADMPVTEVMQLCGYSDLSNFIRSFKKHVGLTPGEYKKDPDLLRLQALHKVAERSALK